MRLLGASPIWMKLSQVRDEAAPEVGVGRDGKWLFTFNTLVYTDSMDGKQYVNMIEEKVWLL